MFIILFSSPQNLNTTQTSTDWLTLDEHSIMYVSLFPVTFEKAQQWCRRFKSHLFEFNDVHEINNLVYMLRVYAANRNWFWLGYQLKKGEIRSISGYSNKVMIDKATFKPFCQGDCVTTMCVSIGISGTLYSDLCNFHNFFICKKVNV